MANFRCLFQDLVLENEILITSYVLFIQRDVDCSRVLAIKENVGVIGSD